MQAWTSLTARRSQLVCTLPCIRRYTATSTRPEKRHGCKSEDGILQEEGIIIDEADTKEIANLSHDITACADDGLETGRMEVSTSNAGTQASFLKGFQVPEGQMRTHRIRKHGKDSLPLSPVIDPVFAAARNKWQTRKAMPPKSEEMTPFQKKLYDNPYAHALATPVRESQLTDTHLPSHFLLPLSLHRSSEPPHKPTWTPTSLLLGKARGPQTYVDLSLSAVRLIERHPKRVKDVIGPAHQAQVTPLVKKEMRLRPHLGVFVLELLRKNVLRSLAWLLKHPTVGLVERCDGGAYATGELESKEGREVAAVLYLTPITTSAMHELSMQVAREVLEAELLGRRAHNLQLQIHGPTSNHDARTPNTTCIAPLQNPAAVYPPARYPVVRLQQAGIVPVFGLFELLGDANLEDLVRGTTFEEARCLVLRGGDTRSLKVQLALLRLQEYLIQGDISDAVGKMAGK